MAGATITQLIRYPVKGLSPDALGSVELQPGETMPFDRSYAIENGPGAFDADAPRHLPKVTFLCLMRDERLATLDSSFNTATHLLTLARNAMELASGDLRTAEGRGRIEAFFARDMAAELRGRPRVVAAPGHSFSDVREKCVHIINLASLRAVELAIGTRMDPLRFRANVIIDGLPAWTELDWVGREVTLGIARVSVFTRTARCAATNVDPATGVRAGDVPDMLWRTQGHRDFGIYGLVTKGGAVSVGDRAHTT